MLGDPGKAKDDVDENSAEAAFQIEVQLRDFIAQNLSTIPVNGQRLRLYSDEEGREDIEYLTALVPSMGSRIYARRSRQRRDNIVAMVSLEIIGYYSDRSGSQRYPFPLGLLDPLAGNFSACVSDLGSRPLLHEARAAFRRHAGFPPEGVAAPAFIPGVDWSDHWSFLKEGYPALMVTDTAPYRYPHAHTVQDTPDKVDCERLARVVASLQLMLRDPAGVE